MCTTSAGRLNWYIVELDNDKDIKVDMSSAPEDEITTVESFSNIEAKLLQSCELFSLLLATTLIQAGFNSAFHYCASIPGPTCSYVIVRHLPRMTVA